MSMWCINRKQFLEPGESVLMISNVKKIQKLTSQKVQLILTNKPKLIYVDPSKLVVKGNIIWSDNSNDLNIQVISPSQFKVFTVKSRCLLSKPAFFVFLRAAVILIFFNGCFCYHFPSYGSFNSNLLCSMCSQRKLCLSRMLSNEQCSGKRQLKLSRIGDIYLSAFRLYSFWGKKWNCRGYRGSKTVGFSYKNTLSIQLNLQV